jgi:hypothetical protein
MEHVVKIYVNNNSSGTSPYSFSLMRLLIGEVTNINFIVFGLTRSDLEPDIYHSWGEYANHYTTDAVNDEYKIHWQLTCSRRDIA